MAESNDEQIRNSANYMRVSRYIRQGNTGAAQEVLDTIQDKTDLISALPDKLMLQVSIYLQQHKSELAALELEKALFKEITRVQMLHLLEQMLEALTTHWSLTGSVLYHRMAPETKTVQSRELMSVLLSGLETDPECAYLREHPKFKDLIEKYKDK